MPTTLKVTVLSGTSRQNTGILATLSILDRKEVDKAFAQLKKDGAIVSPVRCKWQPAEYINEGAAKLLKLAASIDTDKMPSPTFMTVIIGVGKYAYR